DVQLDKLPAIERRYASREGAASVAQAVAGQLRGLTTGRTDPAEAGTVHRQAVIALRGLLSQIGDHSNLILDPDLASYYVMSLVVLRLPEVVQSIGQLNAAAHAIVAQVSPTAPAMTAFLLVEGALGATADAIRSDLESGFRGNPDGTLRQRLESSQQTSGR